MMSKAVQKYLILSMRLLAIQIQYEEAEEELGTQMDTLWRKFTQQEVEELMALLGKEQEHAGSQQEGKTESGGT